MIFKVFLINLAINDQVTFLAKWYSFPLFIALFQIVQIFSRIPLTLLARKMNSKKIVILGTIVFFALTLCLVLISNFALWSIFVTVLSSGVTGSIFGMKNQHFSQSLQFKKTFTSSTLVFFVPFISDVFGKVVNSFVPYNQISSFWLLFSTLIFTILGFVGFSFLPKSFEKPFEQGIIETKNTFLFQRNFKDVLFLTLSFALVSGLYFFTFSLGSFKQYKLNSFESGLMFLAVLLGYCFLSFFLIKKVSVQKIRFLSLIFTSLLLILIGILMSLNVLNKKLWIAFLFLTSFSFGVYNVLLFGSALNFDNKNKLLVFSFLLTVNSLVIGVSIFLGSWIIFKLNSLFVGLSLIGYTIIVFAFCQLFFNHKVPLKNNKTIFVLNQILEEAKTNELN